MSTDVQAAAGSVPAGGKTPESCVMVIFGASGDLTERKLIPALYNLASEQRLPERFAVIGYARSEMSHEAFRQKMGDAVSEFSGTGLKDEPVWKHFAANLHYVQGGYEEPEGYRRLREFLSKLDHGHASPPNAIFYLAMPPDLYAPVIQQIAGAGLVSKRSSQGSWPRIVIEKPFGHDLKTAQELNRQVHEIFDESQVYRIDHYLGKETVQNIMVFRFGNSLFEPVWNRNYIDYVEITAAETLGVGSRGGYYEKAGALRDMVANHLLQLLTLTAMEPPTAFDADSVREQKVQVLRSIHPLMPGEVAKRTVRGQYGAGEVGAECVLGYREEKNVARGSLSETYVALEFRIENWRWGGVPFYLRMGKRLGRSLTEIAVHLKRTPQALFARTPNDYVEPNVIAWRIQPNEGITVTFGAKRPGAQLHTAAVDMDFCYQTVFGVRLPAAYETLLLDAMRGDATLFTRRDEVEAQWRLITPIEEAWAEQEPPEFPNYAAGSEGPGAADELLARNGHKWRAIRDTFTGCDAAPKGKQT